MSNSTNSRQKNLIRSKSTTADANISERSHALALLTVKQQAAWRHEGVRADELLTLNDAAAELGESAEALELFVTESFLFRRGFLTLGTQPRFVWQMVGSIRPIFDIYSNHNSTGRCCRDLARRSEAAQGPLLSLASEGRARVCHPRPSEALKSIRPRLRRLQDNRCELEASKVWERLSQIAMSVPEIMVTWLDVRPDYLLNLETRTGDYTSATMLAELDDWVRVVDLVISCRARRGPRERPLLSVVPAILRKDYLWLTGKRTPDWTNEGLTGNFIEFERSAYRTVGIDAPSQTMLRGARSRT